MGRKKKKQIKPWCWYCNREFDDENILINHQKSKHFKCEICYKKLFTGPGLAIHCMQVHKEKIDKIANAIPERVSVEIEVYGMEGIPPEELKRHECEKLGKEYMESSDAKKAKLGQPPLSSLAPPILHLPPPGFPAMLPPPGTSGAFMAPPGAPPPPMMIPPPFGAMIPPMPMPSASGVAVPSVHGFPMPGVPPFGAPTLHHPSNGSFIPPPPPPARPPLLANSTSDVISKPLLQDPPPPPRPPVSLPTYNCPLVPPPPPTGLDSALPRVTTAFPAYVTDTKPVTITPVTNSALLATSSGASKWSNVVTGQTKHMYPAENLPLEQRRSRLAKYSHYLHRNYKNVTSTTAISAMQSEPVLSYTRIGAPSMYYQQSAVKR